MTFKLDCHLNLIQCVNKVRMVISLKRIETNGSDPFFMVNFKDDSGNKLWITPKHPIFDARTKKWVVPKEKYLKTQNHDIDHTIDFVMQINNNNNNGGCIVNVNGIYCITMAHYMFDRFPNLYHPIKATNKCIDYWKEKAKHTFPNCKMIVQYDNSYAEQLNF